MDLNTINKELYKQKPIADFIGVNKDGIAYMTSIPGKIIIFCVPLNEIGDTSLLKHMEAHLLIRYIVTPESTL